MEVHREGLELEEGGQYVGGQRGAHRGSPCPHCQASFNSLMRKLILKNGLNDFRNQILSHEKCFIHSLYKIMQK